MKIIELRAENIKRLKAVTIRPDKAMVLVTGANGQGKSSVLDAIYMALRGKEAIPSHPVRNGEENAVVKLDLGEIVVTRKFTANGGTSLTVQAANGAKFPSPQRMLDDMLGALTFDPLEFSRMVPAKQLETLRGLVRLDVDIDSLDAQNKSDYDQRTILNRELKDFERFIANAVVPADTPAEPVDVPAMMRELDAATKHNTELTNVRNQIRQRREMMAEKQEAIKRLTSEFNTLENAVWELYRVIAGKQEVDTAPLVRQIESAQVTNAAVSKRQQVQTWALESETLTKEIADLTKWMADRTETKRTAIANAEFPVEGLSFGEGEVLLNDIPFAQASSAEQLKVSVGIAMAANPKLRVLRIKDGSLLDSASLNMVEFLADLNDYQVWVEKVDESGTVGIVIEDGAVVPGNG